MMATIPDAGGGAVLQPSINSLFTKRSKPTEVGGILGISAAFLSAAYALAPLVLGAAFQWIGPSAPYFIGGIMLLGLWGFAMAAIRSDWRRSRRVENDCNHPVTAAGGQI